MAEEMPLVKSADEMDAETFLKHINARHVPIGKMTHFGRSNIPGDENESLLRAYHDKIHEALGDGFTSKYSPETPINHRHRPTPAQNEPQEAPE
jgi:hypothetical protein